MNWLKREGDESELQPLIAGLREDPPESLWETIKIPLLAISYCTVSISCVFVNKIILARSGRYKGFGSVEFLMFLQSVMGVVTLYLCQRLHILDFPIRLDWKSISRIALVNTLFVLMTLANAYSLRHLSMPMVSLLKNCQVVLVCLLEFLVLKTRPQKMTIASLSVIVFGSICGSMTDLEFNLIGYISIGVAILSSALYYIAIKIVFKDHKVNEFSMLFYNSVFSIPLFLLMTVQKKALTRAWSFTIHANWDFWILLLVSGFTASGVNITTYLFLNASSPTTFSVLGVVKKITQTLLGYILWSSPRNTWNVVSVCVGVIGGISYSVAKKLEKKQ